MVSNDSLFYLTFENLNIPYPNTTFIIYFDANIEDTIMEAQKKYTNLFNNQKLTIIFWQYSMEVEKTIYQIRNDYPNIAIELWLNNKTNFDEIAYRLQILQKDFNNKLKIHANLSTNLINTKFDGSLIINSLHIQKNHIQCAIYFEKNIYSQLARKSAMLSFQKIVSKTQS